MRRDLCDQYILCNNLATLLWLAHLGTLEFHGWHSRIRNGSDVDFAASGRALEASVLERPDYVLFATAFAFTNAAALYDGSLPGGSSSARNPIAASVDSTANASRRRARPA